jgi:hypothetical protein
LLEYAITATENKWQKGNKKNKEWIKLKEISFQEIWESILTIVLPLYKEEAKFVMSYLSIIERYSGSTNTMSSLKTLRKSHSLTINLGLVTSPNSNSVDDWTFFGNCGFTHPQPGSILIYPSSLVHKSNPLPKSDNSKKYNLISIIEIEKN